MMLKILEQSVWVGPGTADVVEDENGNVGYLFNESVGTPYGEAGSVVEVDDNLKIIYPEDMDSVDFFKVDEVDVIDSPEEAVEYLKSFKASKQIEAKCTPTGGEDRNEFVSRCIQEQYDKGQDKNMDHDAIVGMCEGIYTDKKGSVEKKGEYAGWTNYETWHTALIVGNSQGDIEYWNERIEELIGQAPEMEMVKDNIWPVDRAPVYTLAEEIKGWLEDIAAEYELPDILAGLLTAGMGEVDYTELAEIWVRDYKENKAYEEKKNLEEGNMKTESIKDLPIENSKRVLGDVLERNSDLVEKVHYNILDCIEVKGVYIPSKIKWVQGTVDDFSNLEVSLKNKKEAEEFVIEKDGEDKSVFDK